MKELSVEQKAKRYDEALAMAKKCITYIPDEAVNKYMLDMFPELAESEDEKIRKEIIKLVKFFYGSSLVCKHTISKDKMVAWLEKQGEQNTADKVESKFKDGQWIVFNGLTLYIKEVVKGYYRTISIDGTPNSYDWGIDNAARLWTLQDAKDGDVLYFSNETIVIFKDLYNEDTFHSYCHIENGTFNVNTDELPDWWEGKGFHPATKEQRDILFAKMHEAGYEWNADEKVVNMEKGK